MEKEEIKSMLEMTKRNYNKYDVPLSFRVPHKLHSKYKSLSGFERKTIQYKFNVWLKKQLKSMED